MELHDWMHWPSWYNQFTIVQNFTSVLTLSQTSLVFTCLQYKSFQNTVSKGEIARNEQFLLFPPSFLPIWGAFCRIYPSWNSHLQTLSVWKSLKLVVWERVKAFTDDSQVVSKIIICFGTGRKDSEKVRKENNASNPHFLFFPHCLPFHRIIKQCQKRPVTGVISFSWTDCKRRLFQDHSNSGLSSKGLNYWSTLTPKKPLIIVFCMGVEVSWENASRSIDAFLTLIFLGTYLRTWCTVLFRFL